MANACTMCFWGDVFYIYEIGSTANFGQIETNVPCTKLSKNNAQTNLEKCVRQPRKLLRGKLGSHVKNGDFPPDVGPGVQLARAAWKILYSRILWPRRGKRFHLKIKHPRYLRVTCYKLCTPCWPKWPNSRTHLRIRKWNMSNAPLLKGFYFTKQGNKFEELKTRQDKNVLLADIAVMSLMSQYKCEKAAKWLLLCISSIVWVSEFSQPMGKSVCVLLFNWIKYCSPPMFLYKITFCWIWTARAWKCSFWSSTVWFRVAMGTGPEKANIRTQVPVLQLLLYFVVVQCVHSILVSSLFYICFRLTSTCSQSLNALLLPVLQIENLLVLMIHILTEHLSCSVEVLDCSLMFSYDFSLVVN